MRVEQQNQILEALQQAAGKDVKTASGIVAEKAKTTKSVSDRQTSIQMKDTTYLNPAREEKKSIAEKIEESSGMDAKIRWQFYQIQHRKKIMRKCRRKVFPWIPQIHIRLLR